MALPDYYARNALAASQVLAGFDEERIAQTLQDVRVGVAIGEEVEESPEGRALLDLTVRLLARLYPVLAIRSSGAPCAAEEARALALRVNPNVEFVAEPTIEIVIGTGVNGPSPWQRIFAGSTSWSAAVSTTNVQMLGRSDNPFGAGVAACLAVGNVFRAVFLTDRPDLDLDCTFPILGGVDDADIALAGSFGEIVLVGAGAIGNAAAWALSRTSMEGVLRLVDHQLIDLGNLQRYVLAERGDEGAPKTEVLARVFTNKMRAQSHAQDFASFVASHGYRWTRFLLALDSARDRRAAQSSLPRWIANAWTQPGDLGVSTHDFLNGACVSCLYLPDKALENEDSIIASSFGLGSDPDRVMQIRVSLHRGDGVPRELLDAVSVARGIPIERLLAFEGRPIRALYTEGFCAGAVIPLGEIGSPRQEVHVPLAHQSALAGVLLGAAAVRDVLYPLGPATHVTRINVLRALQPAVLPQLAKKDPRGICICQDVEYRRVYAQKYASS